MTAVAAKYQDVPRTGNVPGKERLTARQEWIWLWLLQYQEKREGRGATIREVRDATGVAAKNGIKDQLNAIIRKGFATHGEYGSHRTYQAVDPVYYPTVKALKRCL